MEKFRKLGICEDVLKVLTSKKFDKPSEIQEKAIPLVNSGKDVIAGSATGSGKTLAFGAGMIGKVEGGNGVQGLVLAPTRELAEQVSEALREFSYYKKLEVVAVYGGVSINTQIKKLAYADIVVATPGRLLDHLRQNTVNLGKVKFLVLDEADRMWDMGFKDDVGKIVKACPKDRQTMLFSATISGELEDFSNKYMDNPVEVSVESYVDMTKLKQFYYDVRDNEKFSLLVHLLKEDHEGLIMVFCNTRRNSDFVDKNLRLNGINSRAIHGGMDQRKRNRVLNEFKDFFSGVGSRGSVVGHSSRVIVCTDVAARGLDISGVSHVYNYDLPNDHRDYVHRIGRTARAGESGKAVNILASRDYDNFSNIQRHNEKLVIKRKDTPHFGRAKMDISESRGRNSARGGIKKGVRSGGRDSRRGDSRKGDSRGARGKARGARSGFRGSGRNVRSKGRVSRR